jgi:hypothetical protein
MKKFIVQKYIKGRKRDMKTKLLAAVIPIIIVLAMAAPVLAVQGPVMDTLQFKFYSGTGALYTALTANDIDLMAWPISKAQYEDATTNPDITVAPYLDLGDYELAFNNNLTNAYYYPELFRNPFNYTEFRQAAAYFVDKDGLLAGPAVQGFATRIDTNVARPALDAWVEFNVSQYDSLGNLLGNYPWEYNTQAGLQLLYDNNWYSHVVYPTFTDLLDAYDSGALQAAIGTTDGAIYPPGHEKAGQAMDAIIGYSRSDHPPRLAAGVNFENELKKAGIPVDNTQATSGVCYEPVYVYSVYSYYTSGWSFGSKPLHWYSMNTPEGIYPDGSNFYLINDEEMTYHATMEYPNATSFSGSIAAAKSCQYILVTKAFYVLLYSNKAYMAYRTGMVGVINFRGYGLTTALDHNMLNMYHKDYPAVNTIRYGTLNPPTKLNPIFSTWLWDYEVVDRIFTSYLAINAYKPTEPGKSPADGDLPWMAYDWTLDNSGPGGNAVFHLWFRDDITWHDGTPFTVDDLNYTIHIFALYPDSWGISDFQHVSNFVKVNDYECIVYFDTISVWNFYAIGYDIIPKHIYETIPEDPLGDGGHRGYWPGQNEGFTAEQVFIGTNMWEYRAGSLVQGIGGGITLDAYDGFWMEMISGDIDMAYTWNVGSAPQGGSYKIGLADLVMLANAYGTDGTGVVPFSLGQKGDWEPGCDLAAPAGKVGLSDLVTLAKNYGDTWGSNP